MNQRLSTVAAISILSLSLLIFSGPVLADDITDSINEALEYYKNGEYIKVVDLDNWENITTYDTQDIESVTLLSM